MSEQGGMISWTGVLPPAASVAGEWTATVRALSGSELRLLADSGPRPHRHAPGSRVTLGTFAAPKARCRLEFSLAVNGRVDMRQVDYVPAAPIVDEDIIVQLRNNLEAAASSAATAGVAWPEAETAAALGGLGADDLEWIKAMTALLHRAHAGELDPGRLARRDESGAWHDDGWRRATWSPAKGRRGRRSLLVEAGPGLHGTALLGGSEEHRSRARALGLALPDANAEQFSFAHYWKPHETNHAGLPAEWLLDVQRLGVRRLATMLDDLEWDGAMVDARGTRRRATADGWEDAGAVERHEPLRFAGAEEALRYGFRSPTDGRQFALVLHVPSAPELPGPGLDVSWSARLTAAPISVLEVGGIEAGITLGGPISPGMVLVPLPTTLGETP